MNFGCRSPCDDLMPNYGNRDRERLTAERAPAGESGSTRARKPRKRSSPRLSQCLAILRAEDGPVSDVDVLLDVATRDALKSPQHDHILADLVSAF